MPAFDASSILHGWINYPPGQFPKLWKWIENEMAGGEFTIPKVALVETGHRSPDCQKWLKRTGIRELLPTQAVMECAITIKAALGIVTDRYHPNGVDENDLLIVATAKEEGCELISNEARQFALPKSKSKYKIPAVCSMATVQVPCIDFLEVLARSGKSFG